MYNRKKIPTFLKFVVHKSYNNVSFIEMLVKHDKKRMMKFIYHFEKYLGPEPEVVMVDVKMTGKMGYNFFGD